MQLINQIRLAMILGILSLVAGVLGHLALTDIYHRNGNLIAEWNMIRIVAVIFLIFIGYTLFTLRNILRNL